MPKYKVLQKSFIGNSICEEGAIVDYDGEASKNLELIPEPKKPRGQKPDDAPASE